MANNDQNDKELNDYLNGNSDLSNAYRASNKTEPSAHLDEKILSAAKEAVESDKHEVKPKFHKASWVKPVSIAAMITLSVSLVVTMQQESGQPLIREPEVEMFDSAGFIQESKIIEKTLSSDDTSAMNEYKLKQSKDKRVDIAAPAPAALGAAVDIYRTEEKVEAPKARMKQDAGKRMLLKEKSQLEILEERVSAEEQVLLSAPTGVEFDDVMDLKRDRQISLQEDALLKIKAMWEEGDSIKAKQAYEVFTENYPGFDFEIMKETLGVNVYNGLLDF